MVQNVTQYCHVCKTTSGPLVVIPSDYERKDYVTKLSYLTARPSLADWLPEPFMFSFLFFCPTGRPTFTRGRAIGNETFDWDGLSGTTLRAVFSPIPNESVA